MTKKLEINFTKKPEIVFQFDQFLNVEQAVDKFLNKKENLKKLIAPLIPTNLEETIQKLIPEVSDGYTPQKGVDYDDGKDGETPSDEKIISLIEPRIQKAKDGTTPKKGIDYFTKKELDEIKKELKTTILSEMPEHATKEEVNIKITEVLDKIRKLPTGGGGAQFLRQLMDVNVGNPTAQQYGLTYNPSRGEFALTAITGGGGAVDSVNGQTGVVVLDTSDIAEATDLNYVSDAQLTVIGNTSGTNTGDVTVSDSSEIDFTLTGQQISASIVAGSIDESKLDTSVNTSLDLADTAVQPATLSSYELLANKATDFTTINNTLYPTVQAVNTAINTAVTGLLDYRGSYDASANLFPATGGSGILGAILSGDFWICSVAGTLGGTPVTLGDLIIAIVDTPGQTAGNWDLIENTLGYTPENVANKENTTIDTNTTKYPTVNLLKTGLDAKQPTGNYITALTGDVTATGPGSVASTIANSAVTTVKIADSNVTLAKIEDISTAHFLGRHTGGSGVVQQVSATQARTVLNVEDGADVTDATNVAAAGAFMKSVDDTDDITDTATNRFTDDTAITRLANTSGTNTGDQTITNSSDATSHTVTLSASGGSVQLIEGSGITLTTGGTGSAGTVTIAASGGSGATTALDNLSAVAINTSLVSDTDNTDDLGTTLKKWANLFVTTIGATGTRITKLWATDIESTNIPTVGGTAILSSLTAPSFTTVELGHATDTTISRVSAGDIAVEGNTIYRAGGTDVPVTDGGTGRSTSTTAYGLIAAGTTATGAHQTLATGSSGQILRSGGASALPAYSTATYPDTAGTSGNVLQSDGTNFVSTTLSAASYTSVVNSAVSSSSYMTYQLMPTVGTTVDVISNGWEESNVVMTANQGGGGIIFYDITAAAGSFIRSNMPGYGSQSFFRFADIASNAIVAKTRIKMLTGPGATEAISWGFNAHTFLEDSIEAGIRFCIADNGGDKLYAVTGDASNNKNTDVTGALTLTDWLNLAMVITSSQVLFYAGNTNALTLVATHSAASSGYIPTGTAQMKIGWGVAANNTPEFYFTPTIISLPTA